MAIKKNVMNKKTAIMSALLALAGFVTIIAVWRQAPTLGDSCGFSVSGGHDGDQEHCSESILYAPDELLAANLSVEKSFGSTTWHHHAFSYRARLWFHNLGAMVLSQDVERVMVASDIMAEV